MMRRVTSLAASLRLSSQSIFLSRRNLLSNDRLRRAFSFYSTASGQKDLIVTNDYVFKSIFSNTYMLGNFLEEVLVGSGKILPEGTKIEDIEFLNTEHIQKVDPAVAKKVVFDMQIKTTVGLFIIEIQNVSSAEYLQRAEFYGALAYSFQNIKGSGGKSPMKDYEQLVPVVIVTVLAQNMFPDHIPCVSIHRNLEESSKENIMKAFSYVFIELPKYVHVHSTPPMNWLLFLKTSDLKQKYTNPAVIEAIKIVEYIRDNDYDKYIRVELTELAARKQMEEAEKKAGKKRNGSRN